MKNKVEMLF